MKKLERGDIESIDFGGHSGKVTKIRGYQNYNITDNDIIAINNPTSKRTWTDTKIKSKTFNDTLKSINPSSYIDFGSNLGYYVFSAAQQGIASTGIDYNKEYINVCEAISARHNITNANFVNSNLNEYSKNIDQAYDFMTVFSVIHHLYNRTEQYKNMDRLLADFAKLAKDVLFEVPTENDPKGHKWTQDSGYTEKIFLASANSMFNSVTRIPGQVEHRPYYLCLGRK